MKSKYGTRVCESRLTGLLPAAGCRALVMGHHLMVAGLLSGQWFYMRSLLQSISGFMTTLWNTDVELLS